MREDLEAAGITLSLPSPSSSATGSSKSNTKGVIVGPIVGGLAVFGNTAPPAATRSMVSTHSYASNTSGAPTEKLASTLSTALRSPESHLFLSSPSVPYETSSFSVGPAATNPKTERRQMQHWELEHQINMIKEEIQLLRTEARELVPSSGDSSSARLTSQPNTVRQQRSGRRSADDDENVEQMRD
ncbi:hypothetical protein GYMLUDRAFT_242533 [Collybiopsis luxurians FD-317 M1]|uniref:Uncharacterized protein n=1 Tax=Collybiopsis luxurians FD-317 M1 TaxID=944289 RepID=A0A0D0CTV3_9AGAR|nr:hypothetical protein GYMLUDRAFT_242533 [Collybiopsis luxurians FD-317 M1]